MATVQNRSSIQVTVKNRPDLTQSFPFNKLLAAQAYAAKQAVAGLKPKLSQGADAFLVRIRDKGYPPLQLTVDSEAAATALVQKVTEERSRGLFVDYTKSHNITFADLMVRYLSTVAPKKKSFETMAYRIEGWLEDSGSDGQRLLAGYRRDLAQRGGKVRKAAFKMRKDISHLDWIHKRLTQVTADDITAYVEDRIEAVEPSTVDRELDIFSAIFNKAIDSWGYHLAVNPMNGVERPKYFNERDRRFRGDEEQRLLGAMRELDKQEAIAREVERRIAEEFGETVFSSLSARKKVLAARRQELSAVVISAKPVAWLEAFLLFQLMTAARRGEALNLTWEDVDLEGRTAFLRETKNGRSRKLPLRRELLELLEGLPRPTAKVFSFTLDWLVGSWKRACELADVHNLHVHDCRHESISRVAETGQFGLVDLQAFSGHRDIRMLLRYSHLCATRMAVKLDEAFKDEAAVRVHQGRKYLSERASIAMKDCVEVPEDDASVALEAQAPLATGQHPTLPSNVILFPGTRTNLGRK